LIHKIRRRTKVLVSFGDCAVTGNVTAMRNPLGGAEEVLKRAYLEGADIYAQIPCEKGIVPVLLDQVLPVHQVVPVEYFLPGCPPPAPRIRIFLEEVLAAKTPQLAAQDIKFG
jgi:NAD-reducing hydrogenase small subunit